MKTSITTPIPLVAVLLLPSCLLWARSSQSTTETTEIARVVRARAFELVDSQGRRRASITIEPPSTVNGRTYPEAVLLRLIDREGCPLVKMEASGDGAALGLWKDSAGKGVQIFGDADGGSVKLLSKDGKEKVVRP